MLPWHSNTSTEESGQNYIGTNLNMCGTIGWQTSFFAAARPTKCAVHGENLFAKGLRTKTTVSNGPETFLSVFATASMLLPKNRHSVLTGRCFQIGFADSRGWKALDLHRPILSRVPHTEGMQKAGGRATHDELAVSYDENFTQCYQQNLNMHWPKFPVMELLGIAARAKPANPAESIWGECCGATEKVTSSKELLPKALQRASCDCGVLPACDGAGSMEPQTPAAMAGVNIHNCEV